MKKLSLLITLSILLSIMACNNTSTKHKGDALTFDWSVAGEIPDSSIGLAGPVTGVTNGVLLVGGGSNFPEAAPWNGGAKKFYKKIFIFDKKGDTLLPLGKSLSLTYNVAYS